jgi:hypothetical protein
MTRVGWGALTEGKFLQCSASSLRVKEVDESQFNKEPGCDDGHVFPADAANGDGVDVLREETADLAPHLLDGDAAGTLGIGEEFREVGWMRLA